MSFAIGGPLGIRRVSGTGPSHIDPPALGKHSIDGLFDSADNVAMVLITGDLVTQVVDVHKGTSLTANISFQSSAGPVSRS